MFGCGAALCHTLGKSSALKNICKTRYVCIKQPSTFCVILMMALCYPPGKSSLQQGGSLPINRGVICPSAGPCGDPHGSSSCSSCFPEGHLTQLPLLMVIFSNLSEQQPSQVSLLMAKTSPQCENTFLLSPDVSEFRCPV